MPYMLLTLPSRKDSKGLSLLLAAGRCALPAFQRRVLLAIGTRNPTGGGQVGPCLAQEPSPRRRALKKKKKKKIRGTLSE